MSASEIYSPAEEEAAFGAVYTEHHQKLLRYCQYRLRDRHEAEDVMQEAFVRAWRTMPANAYGTNFYPWLRVVAGNLCTDVLRKRSRSEPMADIEPGSVDGGMDRITDEEDRELVRLALLRLNDRHRNALMMRESEGLSYDQIAERTGVTSGTVESLLWRARQALRREFTVVAGRAGALAPVPVFGVAAARARAIRQRFVAGLARRVPGLGRLNPGNSAGHFVLAAITALTVVGGIAATFSVGGPRSAGPAALPVSTPSLVSATRSHADSTAAAVAGALASTATGAASTATARVPNPTTTPTVTAPTTPSAPSLSTMHIQNPITSGSAAAATARKAPVGLSLNQGALVVGASPSEATTYIKHTTAETVDTAGQALAGATITPSSTTKETTK